MHRTILNACHSFSHDYFTVKRRDLLQSICMQVVMDIMGVTVTCIVCYLILDLLYGGSAAHAAAAIIPSVL